MYIDKFINYEPFSLAKNKKKKVFEKCIKLLTDHHYKNSKEYKKILDFFQHDLKRKKLSEIPFIPVQLFKKFKMKSIIEKKIFKTLTSSGTSGSIPSKIHLDKDNATNQIKVLRRIMSNILGTERLPMLIIDKNPKIENRSVFSAKSVAIYGFSIFGKKHTYLLNKNEEIDYKILNNFLKMYGKQKFFVFGFTSLIYQNLIKNISTKKMKSNFKNGVLLHGGGWKKLEAIKISNKLFKEKLNNKIKLQNVHNYYALVEQTGSIFIECKKSEYFHTSIFSDIIIRDKNFNILKNKNKGFIQLFSLLPKSYPGHNILTEDIGEIIGEDNCKCGLKGKYFLVHGRAKQSEIRGCSDV